MAEEKERDTEIPGEEGAEIGEESPEQALSALAKELEEQKDKFLRLYSDFETYKRRVQKDREELYKFANEELVKELLPSLDNLETALKHASRSADGLKEGVEMTLRELKRTLERAGLKPIEALGQPFNPEYHHAIAQVEREDLPDKTVVDEMRKGYLFNDKVIRPSLVTVSKKPEQEKESDEVEIKIHNKNSKEDR